MSFSSLGTYACRALQAVYVDYFGKNAPAMKTMGSTALVKYLLSPQNTRGFKQINVETIPGKKRPVAFLIDQPFCFELATPTVDCTTVRTVISNPAQETVFDLDGPAFRVADPSDATKPAVLQFAEADLMKYCTISNYSYITDQIMRYLMKFEEALDKQLAILLAARTGTDAAGNSLVRLPFFVNNSVTNTSALNQDAFFWLEQNYKDIGSDGQFGLIGGKVLNKIIQFQKWSGLNQAGIDLGKIDDAQPYTYYDRNMDSVLGQDTFMQLSPGAVQLVTWNQYKGERRRQVTDLYSKDTIISPSTGLAIDWVWDYDYKCEKWTFEAFLHAELAVNKAGGCGLPTSNGIMKIQDCSNAMAAPVCPEIPSA